MFKTRETTENGGAELGAGWEYLARNLAKVPGMTLENDFNKHGKDGWEFVAVADGYAIFKRPR